MKTALIAVLFAAGATAATAQLSAPAATPDPAPAVQPGPTGNHPGHAQLRADRERVKADKERLKIARATRDDDAIRNAQATLQTDMTAWHADRESLKR